jgi:hypothetical protein
MPAIADQVAAIEDDLQAALAKVDSLTAENDALMKKLAASTADKQDLEAKNGEMYRSSMRRAIWPTVSPTWR